MKSLILTACAILAFASSSFAAGNRIVQKDAHSRTWELEPVDPNVATPRRVIEMETGMNRWNPQSGEWETAPESIEILPGAAIAKFGQYDVTFAHSLSAENAIRIDFPGGTLQGTVLGLAYRHINDYVVFANVKDCVADVLGNEVTYRQVFDTVAVDVKYVLTKWNFEQFVVVKEKLPSPEVFGLPRNSVLEVITAFNAAPVPEVRSEVLRREFPAAAAKSGTPSLFDENLNFGSVLIPPGTAFVLGNQPSEGIRVAKGWIPLLGRSVLVEQIDYEEFEILQRDLPAPDLQAGILQKAKPVRDRAVALVALRPGLQRAEVRPMTRLAAASRQPEGRGVAIDYQLISSGSANYTFRGDTTYLISSTATFSGTTVFEGGTVLKFNTNAPSLNLYGPISCKTDAYRPAIFTSRHDSSFGESISGGTPSTYYAGTALAINGSFSGPVNIHDMRFLYAGRAIDFYSSSNHTLTNIQILDCATAVGATSTDFAFRNGLVVNATNAFLGNSAVTGRLEHITFDRIRYFTFGDTASLRLTNCMVANVTNAPTGSYVGESNAVVSGSSLFQTVGYGSYYLATNSPWRNMGTTNINSALRDMLANRTTYPPIAVTNTALMTDTIWYPTAGRDTDIPDLGYHADPLDFFVSGLSVSNAVLIATNGCAIGLDYSTGSWGMLLKNASFVSQGTAGNLNPVVRAHMAQERGSGNPGTRALFYDGSSSTVSNILRFRFALMAQLPNDGYMLYTGQKFRALEWSHSEIYNSSLVIDTAGSNPLVCGLTNSIWYGGAGQFGLASSSTNSIAHARNNLFKSYSHHFVGGKSTWTAQDNLVDNGGLHDHGTAITNICNAYYIAASSLSGGTSNLTLTNLTYEIGPLSAYYQPTNSVLIQRGSVGADMVGLWHFCAVTNQVKETNSVVDIGPHWVAVDGNGLPLDEDGDSVPDYWEDWNGNGTVDSGETDGTDPDDLGLRVFITRPRKGSVLP